MTTVKSDESVEPLRDWFRAWGKCVAAVDFNAARPLFSEDVVGFGTHIEFVQGLDRLQSEQWQKVWPNIDNFRFEVDRLVGTIDDDNAWAAVLWSSTGFHEDGTAYDRPGRTTATFRKLDGSWLGTHTHFSLKPGTPPRTFGKKS